MTTATVDTAPVTANRIDLPQPLSAQQVQDFVRDGFHIAHNLITPAELAELKEDALRAARGQYKIANLDPLPADATDQQVLARILCIHQLHYVSATAMKYVKHPKICGMLSQLAGAHLPYWDGSVKCMQSMYFVKPPQFQGQAWHQDEIYIPTRDRSLIGAWIAVDDATIENGCLWVIPGSQQSGYLYPQRPHGNEDEFDFAPESFGFDESQEVPVEVKAGAVVFFNGYLLHRSRKNRSNIYRRVLVNHYMNAWSLLPWFAKDPTTNDGAARADSRRIVPVAGIDPYAWKGVEACPQEAHMRMCKAIKPDLGAKPAQPNPNADAGKPAGS